MLPSKISFCSRTIGVEQFTISLRHTSKYPCNHRLRRIFVARPIIGHAFPIWPNRCTTICPDLCQSAIFIDIRSRLRASLGIKQEGSITQTNLFQCAFNPSEPQEWIVQFPSHVNSQSTPLDDVKLAYLKTL